MNWHAIAPVVFTVGWIAWIVWFVVEEAVAILSNETANTLSGHVWYWFAVLDPAAAFRHLILLAFLVWLLFHLALGWWG